MLLFLGISWTEKNNLQANAGVHSRALRRLYGPLTEEEVELVIVALGTVRDELGMDERR